MGQEPCKERMKAGNRQGTGEIGSLLQGCGSKSHKDPTKVARIQGHKATPDWREDIKGFHFQRSGTLDSSCHNNGGAFSKI